MELILFFQARNYLPASPVLPFPSASPHAPMAGSFDLDVFKRCIALLGGASSV